jgi:hypothetical protein
LSHVIPPEIGRRRYLIGIPVEVLAIGPDAINEVVGEVATREKEIQDYGAKHEISNHFVPFCVKSHEMPDKPASLYKRHGIPSGLCT